MDFHKDAYSKIQQCDRWVRPPVQTLERFSQNVVCGILYPSDRCKERKLVVSHCHTYGIHGCVVRTRRAVRTIGVTVRDAACYACVVLGTVRDSVNSVVVRVSSCSVGIRSHARARRTVFPPLTTMVLLFPCATFWNRFPCLTRDLTKCPWRSAAPSDTTSWTTSGDQVFVTMSTAWI